MHGYTSKSTGVEKVVHINMLRCDHTSAYFCQSGGSGWSNDIYMQCPLLCDFKDERVRVS